MLCCTRFLGSQLNTIYMAERKPNIIHNVTGSQYGDPGSNLVELVDFLDEMERRQPTYPQWAKFDTATTMSDNNGGVIRF